MQKEKMPVSIITGFLGVGKTTVILNLLQQKPSHERWAILVNEFGEVNEAATIVKCLPSRSATHACRLLTSEIAAFIRLRRFDRVCRDGESLPQT